MDKNYRISLLAIAILLSGIKFADISCQACLPEGIVFSSQEQLEAFSVSYPGCEQISGSVIIAETTAGNITNLQGLAQLSSVGGFLEISNNKELTNLQGLDSLTSIGKQLAISSNTFLTSLDGLDALRDVGKSTRIASNHSLVDMTALSSLKTIRGDLSISENSALKKLGGLDSIAVVEGQLNITSNANLTSLEGLKNLTTIGNIFHLFGNPKLTSLEGLNALNSTGSDLIIDDNDALLSLKGLDQLDSIGGFLQVVNNDNLFNLNGLESLRSIRGLLQIINNREMISLSGIDSLDHANITNLALLSSGKLTSCSVRSICEYLSNSSSLTAIADNGNGCNSREEILAQCTRDGQNSSPLQAPNILLFPNPTFASVTVKGRNVDGEPFRIFDSIGRIVLKGRVTESHFEVFSLAAGLYFVEISTKDKRFIKPFIKVE